MKQTIFCLIALIALPAWAEPHFIAERQEGLKLVQGGKHCRGCGIFREAGRAETARKPEQKADALRHAALATARNKDLEAALFWRTRFRSNRTPTLPKVQIYWYAEMGRTAHGS